MPTEDDEGWFLREIERARGMGECEDKLLGEGKGKTWKGVNTVGGARGSGLGRKGIGATWGYEDVGEETRGR